MVVDPYKIVRYPLVTEKGTNLAEDNKYLFCVDKRTNKSQVKFSIESIYKVTVERINILNTPRKKKRYRFKIEGYKPGFKKAIVTLKKGDKIAIT